MIEIVFYELAAFFARKSMDLINTTDLSDPGLMQLLFDEFLVFKQD